LTFGFLFQGAALFDSLTVGQNVTFACAVSPASRARLRTSPRAPELVG